MSQEIACTLLIGIARLRDELERMADVAPTASGSGRPEKSVASDLPAGESITGRADSSLCCWYFESESTLPAVAHTTSPALAGSKLATR